MVVVIIMAHIAFVFGFIFVCTPIAMAWDPSITSGSCLGMPFYTSFSSLTISFDIIMLVQRIFKTNVIFRVLAN